MIVCSKNCYPCCDYCKYAFHKWGEVNGKIVRLAPIGCGLHEDAEHQDMAKACSYCEDFHCMHADEKEVD